ncbi:hypothetical protein L6164_018419 [Bauhinia variegata]|uniref:Uncharacterized protein n=1 Tax=Bauhinia variegata TaxID=167791 RepID=A0ACB9NCW5_BAUVA|nr:hypothetical protein L6164_018419 [Bauhinia variegata]
MQTQSRHHGKTKESQSPQGSSGKSEFRGNSAAEQAILDSLRSREFNRYAPTAGLLQTTRAIAEYLSCDLPYQLSSDDVFITSGCTQAIDVPVSLLVRPGANILLPRPGFPVYELSTAFRQVEVRHYDLLPEEPLWKRIHLPSFGEETVKRLGIVVIADEVYGHLAFVANPFVFGSIVPVLTLGLLSKRRIIPGWRLGWLVTNDPCGTFRKPKVVERMNKYFDILGGPASFIQAAVPSILEQTDEVFFKKTINILRHTSDICCKEIKDIPCISRPHKPQGSMVMIVQ